MSAQKRKQTSKKEQVIVKNLQKPAN